jgi:cellulose biosynthesis protein BcsQ
VDPSLDHLGTGDALAADRSGAAADMIVRSGWSDDIWLLPAAGDLTERDAEARTANGRRRLAKALKGVTDDFDLVLIDCAPSLGLNTTNGLAAADAALVIVEPSVFGLRGIGPALDLIEEVWASDNNRLDLGGVVLNRVPTVSATAQERIADLKKMVGSKSIWTPYVPQRVLINQAHHERAPIHSFGAQGRELASLFDTLFRKLRRSLNSN